MRTLRLAAFIISLYTAAMFVTPAFSYGPTKTHPKVTTDTLNQFKKLDKDGLYQEVYHPTHFEKIKNGSRDQDFGSVGGNGRGFRHYYDPDTTQKEKGVQYHDYYQIWMYKDELIKFAKESLGKDYGGGAEQMISEYLGFDIEDIEVTKPAGGYYPGALDWARNSAGESDDYNWEGALKAYDYTNQSRLEAYYRLGHVIHLLQDMAEPDHAYNIPHPGSSTERRANNTIYYGYERLVDEIGLDLNIPAYLRRNTLDDYFNDMAHQAKKILTGSGFTVPLGLNPYFMVSEKLNLAVRDIAWDPEIDYQDTALVFRYRAFAQNLLSYAAQLSIGLCMDFYDIVNQPPYVQNVIITQDFEEKYNGLWDDVTQGVVDGGQERRSYTVVAKRQLQKSIDISVHADREAVISITFGPSARLAERIDPAGIKVFLGDEEVKGKMLDERTWEGTVIPKLRQGEDIEDQKLKIYAKDVDNHYPRQGLPSKGYELDKDPATPAKLADYEPPYGWKQYEPGWDENHLIKVLKEAPPIVKSLDVYCDGAFYKRASWKYKEEERTASLTDDGPVNKNGIEILEDTTALLTIGFDREVVPERLNVMFGSLEISMKKVKENLFEGEIPLYQLRRKGLDSEYEFTITAETPSGMVLDGNPATVVYMEKGNEGWLNYEQTADTVHRLRVFCEMEEEVGEGPLLRGYLYAWPEEHYEYLHRWPIIKDDWSFERPYTHPVGTKPLANFNVIIAVAYFKLEDKALFDRFMSLVRTRIAIENKIKQGVRKVSQQEYKDCEELFNLGKKIMPLLKYEFGTKPGWMTTTDGKGEFTYTFQKYPGKDGIIYMKPVIIAFPPAGKTTEYKFTPGEGLNTQFYPFWTEFYDSQLMKITAMGGAAQPGNEEELLKKMDELKTQEEILAKAEEELKKVKEKWAKLPENIEKSWTERALKEQRALEQEYIRQHGSPLEWSEEIRKQFEVELAEVPSKSKKSWEENTRAFRQKRDKAVNEAGRNADSERKKLSVLKDEVEQIKSQRKDSAQPGNLGINFSTPVLRDPLTDKRSLGRHTFQIVGPFSGQSVTPELKVGYDTKAYLVKQEIGSVIEDDMQGLNPETGYYSVSVNLNSKYDVNNYKPPFEFRFDKPLGRHLLVYDFRANKGPHPEDNEKTMSSSVCTVFHNEPFDFIRKLPPKDIWYDFRLPPIVEVEGYPITDRKQFDALWAELERCTLEYERLTKKYQQVRDAVAAGSMTPEQGDAKAKELWEEFCLIQEKARKTVQSLRILNPAFQYRGM